jgi:hypothetical protein
MATTSARRSTPGRTRSGAVTFAGVMLLVTGAFNLLDGVVALVNDDYYRVSQLLFGDFTAWGIWWLFCGAVLVVTGWLVLARRTIGLMLGVAAAGLNAFTQLMFLGAYPAWSIAAMVVDGLIIYALTVHVDDFD